MILYLYEWVVLILYIFSVKTALYIKCIKSVLTNSELCGNVQYKKCRSPVLILLGGITVGREFGICRISTKKQSIDRQVRNILAAYPNAIIIKEVYTGTKFQGRKEFDKVLKSVTSTDTLIFDSVSRMSRNADEGVALYFSLFDQGVELVFLKEPHVNTSTYKSALENQISLTGDEGVDYILSGVNQYLKKLAEKQIRLAFEQSEKEVMDLRKRTSEGLQTAKLNGKQVGAVKGKKLVTKKSVASKARIQELSKSFGGALSDRDVIALLGISRNSYYKYKKEIMKGLVDSNE